MHSHYGSMELPRDDEARASSRASSLGAAAVLLLGCLAAVAFTVGVGSSSAPSSVVHTQQHMHSVQASDSAAGWVTTDALVKAQQLRTRRLAEEAAKNSDDVHAEYMRRMSSALAATETVIADHNPMLKKALSTGQAGPLSKSQQRAHYIEQNKASKLTRQEQAQIQQQRRATEQAAQQQAKKGASHHMSKAERRAAANNDKSSRKARDQSAAARSAKSKAAMHRRATEAAASAKAAKAAQAKAAQTQAQVQRMLKQQQEQRRQRQQQNLPESMQRRLDAMNAKHMAKGHAGRN